MTYWRIGSSNMWLFDSPCYSWSHWWVFCLPVLVPCCGKKPVMPLNHQLMNRSAHDSFGIEIKGCCRINVDVQKFQCDYNADQQDTEWILLWHTADCESAHGVHGLMTINKKLVFNSESQTAAPFVTFDWPQPDSIFFSVTDVGFYLILLVFILM